MQTEFKIDIKWTAFPLHPETPEAGLTLEELFAGRPVDIKQVLAHLNRTAKDLGLPFGKRERTYNSRLAQELGKLANWPKSRDTVNNTIWRPSEPILPMV